MRQNDTAALGYKGVPMTTPHPIPEISVMIKSSNPKRIAIPLANSSSRPSKTKSPKPESAKASIKTSISHILPENWESPITQPRDAAAGPEKTSVKNKLVDTEPISAEEKTFKEKLASLYTTFPAAARTQLTEARFTKYMYRAITHDNALRALFETKELPVISNLDNLNSETERQYPFARYASFTIKIEGHENGTFVFEKRQDYKLIGWCQPEPFSFLVAQTAISPHQSPPPSSVCTMDRPIEAKLTTSTHVIKFSKGKVCRFQNKNVIG